MRRVEDGVERDGQFDDAEAGAQMAAGDRDGVDDLGAQLVGHLTQLRAVQRLQVGGRIDVSSSGVSGPVRTSSERPRFGLDCQWFRAGPGANATGRAVRVLAQALAVVSAAARSAQRARRTKRS